MLWKLGESVSNCREGSAVVAVIPSGDGRECGLRTGLQGAPSSGQFLRVHKPGRSHSGERDHQMQVRELVYGSKSLQRNRSRKCHHGSEPGWSVRENETTGARVALISKRRDGAGIPREQPVPPMIVRSTLGAMPFRSAAPAARRSASGSFTKGAGFEGSRNADIGNQRIRQPPRAQGSLQVESRDTHEVCKNRGQRRVGFDGLAIKPEDYEHPETVHVHWIRDRVGRGQGCCPCICLAPEGLRL